MPTDGAHNHSQYDDQLASLTVSDDVQNSQLMTLATEIGELKSRVSDGALSGLERDAAIADLVARVEALEGSTDTSLPPVTTPTPITDSLFAFQPEGWTWHKRPPVNSPTHPTGLFVPPNNYIDGDAAYPDGVEIVGAAVDRPRYDAARRTAMYLRSRADYPALTPQTLPRNVEVFETLNPVRCIPAINTGSSTKVSLTGGTMPGVFAGAQDYGWNMKNADEWADWCVSVLADRSWWKDHNFRSHTILLAAAAASNSSNPAKYVDAIGAALNDMIRSTLNGLVNVREVDRDRSIHYQLYEVHGWAWTALWLLKHNASLSPEALKELKPYLAWLRSHVGQAVALNNKVKIEPTKQATWYKFSVGGKEHTEIGPLDVGHWGPSCELIYQLGWVEDDAPPKLRGFPSRYHIMARVPTRR